MDPTKTPKGSPACDCSLLAAVAEWDKLVAKKWAEIRAHKGYFIAIYRPQIGHQEDLRRRRDTSQQVMRWTVEFFAQHGHAIECVLDDDGESFGIRKANESSSTTGGAQPTMNHE